MNKKLHLRCRKASGGNMASHWRQRSLWREAGLGLGVRVVGDRTHSVALAPLIALDCLHGPHMHSWAFLTFIPLHPTSLPHGVKQVKRPSFRVTRLKLAALCCRPRQSLALCSHWGCDAGRCKARCGNHTDFKTRSEKSETGTLAARSFLGNFRLCMWLLLSFWRTALSTWKAHALSQLSGEPRKDYLEFWTTHNGHTL